MIPDASTLWPGRRWTLALLLACLGMIGPFAIDTYLPAFAGIGSAIGATPVQMQQTLSSYLLGFAVMNLFHGALADSLGRRPVVLVGVAVFTLASVGCALSDSIGTLVFFRALQGASAGVGMVVSRAIIRDLYAPADAQRMMSQVTIFFGIAPAVAPMIGGLLFEWADWHSIFWLLAVLGLALLVANWRWLPETLPPSGRQLFRAGPLLRGYVQLAKTGASWPLSLPAACPSTACSCTCCRRPCSWANTCSWRRRSSSGFSCCPSAAWWVAPCCRGGWPGASNRGTRSAMAS